MKDERRCELKCSFESWTRVASNHNNVNKIIFFNSSSRSSMWSVNVHTCQCENHEHNNVDAVKYLWSINNSIITSMGNQ